MLGRGCHVSVLKGVHDMCSYPGKHDKKWALNSFWQPCKDLYTPHWGPNTFMELSRFFSPCTSAKLCAPILAPFRTVGFWKNKWQKHREDVNNFDRKDCFTVAWFPLEVISNNIWNTNPCKPSKTAQRPSSPSSPWIFCQEISNQLGRSTNFHHFLQVPGLCCLDLFRFKASLIISRACNGAPRRQCPHRGETCLLFKTWFLHNANNPPTWWKAPKTRKNNNSWT